MDKRESFLMFMVFVVCVVLLVVGSLACSDKCTDHGDRFVHITYGGVICQKSDGTAVVR